MSGEEDGVASTSELLYEKDGHIAIIVLNRPHRGNALTPTMHDRMHAIWRDVQDDDDIRVAIITGAGDRHFSTGADVDVIAERGRVTQGSGPLHTEVFWSPRHANVLKPVICAVNGVCAGAGLHFVADADIVLASPAASFMDTHVNVGMVGGVENTAHNPHGKGLPDARDEGVRTRSGRRGGRAGPVDEVRPGDGGGDRRELAGRGATIEASDLAVAGSRVCPRRRIRVGAGPHALGAS
jgi:enoyl-CoA hydratase/carnithine racemase